ncbi:MAG: hypothetical protein K6B74_00425 [Ruminococcus sp.]|nr:hypothetical protein [Ruminococcus sp.]
MHRSDRLTLVCTLTLAAALAGCGDVTAPSAQAEIGMNSAAEKVTFAAETTAPATTTSAAETTKAAETAAEPEIYGDYLTDLSVTDVQFSRAEISCGRDTVTIRFKEPSCVLELYMMKRGEGDFSKIPLEKDETGALTAELPFVGGDLAELRVTGEIDGETVRNEYFLDRSESTDKGYIFRSLDSGTEAYMNTDKENSFTLLTDNTRYEKDGMTALSQATFITAEDVSAFTGGEIYSVVSYEAPAERSTVSRYKYSGGEWTALKTDLTDEHECIGVRADLDGEGLYVIFGVSK